MGGKGTFIQLFGTEGKWGCYVVEVPPRGALNAERHMYEEIMVVVEGRGTTEIWIDGQKKRHSFEWQTGSMFSIPLNTCHRIVNAASSPAIILVATTAPNVMNLFRDTDWIFNYTGDVPSALRRQRRLLQAEGRHQARRAARPCACANRTSSRTSSTAKLYLDNRRSPGYTRVEPSDGRQRVLRLRRRAPDRALLEGARAHLVRHARLHQRQGLHLHVAAHRSA